MIGSSMFGGSGMESLSALSGEEQVAYMKAMSYLAKIDGHYGEEEKAFLQDLAVFYGVSAEKVKEVRAAVAESDENSIIEDLKKIKNRRAALELIKDMCLLAHQDGILSDEEVLYIGKAGLAMGVSLEKVEQISKWIIDRIIWLEESKLIFEE